MTPISFTVELTERDIARLYEETRPYWQALTPVAYLVALLGIGVAFLGPDAWPAASGMVAGGLCLVFIPRGFKALLVRQFRKTPSALGPVRYEFAEDSVRVAAQTSQTEVQWQVFVKRKETPGYLCLFLGPVTGYVIPLGQLPPEQAAALRELASRVPAASGMWTADIPAA